MPKKQSAPKVIHAKRPELGVGEVGEVFEGKPRVVQVFWPDPDKYGFYLIDELRRVRTDGSVEETPPPTSTQ
jgi:hypothetical protein